MNTHRVTNQKFIRHLGRFLGFILGIFTVAGMIMVLELILSLYGSSVLARSDGLLALFIPLLILAFGVLLLVPRRWIREWKPLRYLFALFGAVLLWRCGSALLFGLDEVPGGWLLGAIFLILTVSGIAIWNVVAVFRDHDEAADAGQPDSLTQME